MHTFRPSFAQCHIQKDQIITNWLSPDEATQHKTSRHILPIKPICTISVLFLLSPSEEFSTFYHNTYILPDSVYLLPHVPKDKKETPIHCDCHRRDYYWNLLKCNKVDTSLWVLFGFLTLLQLGVLFFISYQLFVSCLSFFRPLQRPCS